MDLMLFADVGSIVQVDSGNCRQGRRGQSIASIVSVLFALVVINSAWHADGPAWQYYDVLE